MWLKKLINSNYEWNWNWKKVREKNANIQYLHRKLVIITRIKLCRWQPKICPTAYPIRVDKIKKTRRSQARSKKSNPWTRGNLSRPERASFQQHRKSLLSSLNNNSPNYWKLVTSSLQVCGAEYYHTIPRVPDAHMWSHFTLQNRHILWHTYFKIWKCKPEKPK